MAKTVTAAMWAIDMAELTGSGETIWLSAPLNDTEPAGEALPPTLLPKEEQDTLLFRLRGSMEGRTLYAVPIRPGLAEPWLCPGLLLTDDPAMAGWFLRRPGEMRTDLLDGEAFLRVLHLSHAGETLLAVQPEDHTVWALGADRESICRAISLGLGTHEGRWDDWLAAPMTVRGGVGTFCPEGTPHWLRIGSDGKLWAVDPWADSLPEQGLDALVVQMPDADAAYPVSWTEMVLCAAACSATAQDGVFGVERWYDGGICQYLNQWDHTQDIIPWLPACYIGAAGQISAPAAEPFPWNTAAADPVRQLLEKLGGSMERMYPRLKENAENLQKKTLDK